ncbi:MAG: hypothetical protein ACUVWX_08055 [Kiritimatiellia bacterium]
MKIRFALACPTDVEVSILNAEGHIVRRLAAGLVGAKAPPPLKAELEQELVWDGKDDGGNSATGGPFRVRVAAGLGVQYDGTAFGSEARPDVITAVLGLACARDGRVYVLCERWHQIWWRATSIHVFTRDGKYERTIKPFPSILPRERLTALTELADEQGRPIPVIYRVLAMSFYPKEDIAQHMTVDPKGTLHFLVRRAGYHGPALDHGNEKSLASLAPDGAPALEQYAGPVFESRRSWGDVYLAAASDGSAVFLTGYEQGESGDSGEGQRPNASAVWRIPLPERNNATVFLGDPTKPGTGGAALNDPRGLATDGKGRLYVADRGNNRVLVVSEKDGKILESWSVESPLWVGVHRSSAAVYVATADALVKFVRGPDRKMTEKARVSLPVLDLKLQGRVRRSFALDADADSPVIWLGLSRGGPLLSRVEDLGDRFGDIRVAQYSPEQNYYWNLSASPDIGLVSCKVGPTRLRILDEHTGNMRDLNLTGSSGQTYRIGRDGNIYGMDHWKWGIRRWTVDGKPFPFPETENLSEREARGRLASQPSGTTAWERDFDVDRAGNVYVKQRGKVYHGRMRVDKYDRNGKFLGAVLWVVSDGALGPRVDAPGNIYIAECVKPVGQPYPQVFAGKLPSVPIDSKGDVEHQYRWMYGSVLKFGPQGGAVWFPILNEQYMYAFDGTPQLPSDQPRFKVDTVSGDRMKIAQGEVQGAEWMWYGCSYLLDMHPGHNRRCHCTATEFEVDDYGRSYCTDQGRFRIVVLDTAGNEILSFGRYGNQDDVGPEIAFHWFGGLAVRDRWIYIADIGNRRVLRIRKIYAVEETCEIPEESEGKSYTRQV